MGKPISNYTIINTVTEILAEAEGCTLGGSDRLDEIGSAETPHSFCGSSLTAREFDFYVITDCITLLSNTIIMDQNPVSESVPARFEVPNTLLRPQRTSLPETIAEDRHTSNNHNIAINQSTQQQGIDYDINTGNTSLRLPRNLTPEQRRNLTLSNERFPNRLWAVGVAHLYNQPDERDKSKSYRVYLNALQRMILHDLQNQLLGLVSRIVRNETASAFTMSESRRLMSEYCKFAF